MSGNTFPLTALETKECPPHQWYINSDGIGKCVKCNERCNFSQKKNKRDELYREKAANGGRIAQSKKRGRKKKTSISLPYLVDRL